MSSYLLTVTWYWLLDEQHSIYHQLSNLRAIWGVDNILSLDLGTGDIGVLSFPNNSLIRTFMIYTRFVCTVYGHNLGDTAGSVADYCNKARIATKQVLIFLLVEALPFDW